MPSDAAIGIGMTPTTPGQYGAVLSLICDEGHLAAASHHTQIKCEADGTWKWPVAAEGRVVRSIVFSFSQNFVAEKKYFQHTFLFVVKLFVKENITF